ncbi:MAG: cobalamin-dependent protein [Desertimonas sp.]
MGEGPPYSGELNLKQVAAALGVHYMTAYRYVRQGRLEARREGTSWRVHPDAIERFSAASVDPSPNAAVDWAGRLVQPLIEGDEPMAWTLVEAALAAGCDPTDCSLDVIVAALAIVDARRDAGELSAARQPLATAVAYRLIARLGARFRRPGRSRGTVVFGSPTGERHSLPIAVVADLVRLAGFDVLELGPDLPPDAFVAAVTEAPRLIAVGIGITSTDHLDAARATIAAIRTVDADVPIVAGGQAVLNPEVAALLDASAWAPDGRSAVEVIESLVAGGRRARRPSGAADVGPSRRL